jgi:hypothetical protein
MTEPYDQPDVPDGDPSGTTATPAETPQPAGRDDPVAEAVATLSNSDTPLRQRRRAIGQIVSALRERIDVRRPKHAIGWVVDTVASIAPRIPMRDVDALRAQFPGLTEPQIAERLVRNATRATAGVGALGGGVAAIEWAAPPTLLSAPALLAAETVAVVAIELKLIGELQELHGRPVPGFGPGKAMALLTAWAGRRGVNVLVPGRGAAAVLSMAARRQLRDRLVRRFGRNLTTLGPMMSGAAAAAYLNRRATKVLAEQVLKDLRQS